eukprot:11163033-Lingulodinium_polyedra.AAC.1
MRPSSSCGATGTAKRPPSNWPRRKGPAGCANSLAATTRRSNRSRPCTWPGGSSPSSCGEGEAGCGHLTRPRARR